MSAGRLAAACAGLLLVACLSEAPARERAIRPPTPAPPLSGAPPATSSPEAADAGAQAAPAATEAASAASDSLASPGSVPTRQDAAPAEEPEPAPASAPRTSEDGEDPGASAPLGWVAGQPLSAEDLVVEWHRIAGREVWLVLEKLVATRLAYAEAARLGLRLAPEAVELRVDGELARVKQEVAEKAPGLDFEQFVEREFSEPLERYVELLRVGTIRQMLAERVARSWTLENESRSLHVIVVEEAELAAALLERAKNGEDFVALAREFSVDDSKERGGWVPYVVRQETSPLARLAFTTAPGELGGPLEIEASGHHVIVRVGAARAPLEGDWAQVGPEVEESLARDPLSDSEFLHWKLAMERRYPIDVGPLEALLTR